MLNAEEARKITNEQESIILKNHLNDITYQINLLANEGCNLCAHDVSDLEIGWQKILKKELKKKGYKVRVVYCYNEEYLLIKW